MADTPATPSNEPARRPAAPRRRTETDRPVRARRRSLLPPGQPASVSVPLNPVPAATSAPAAATSAQTAPDAPLPLDDFLVGPENTLAHAAVQALARGEAEELGLSPLVIHGPAGVGKSRLLAGLVREWLRRHPGASVAHLEAAEFAARCQEAVERPGGWAELRGWCRALSLFVLEDLQALERVSLALEELGPTLDALAQTGAVVAVSARVAPGQWPAGVWPARLINRLVAGLAVRVDPPGAEARRRFVLDRVRHRGPALSAEAIERLADAADGYRTLEGWLARLALAHEWTSPVGADGRRLPLGRLDVEALLADDALFAATAGPGSDPEGNRTEADRRRARSATGRAVADRVIRAVAARFGVRPSELRSASRRRTLVVPRHLAIYLARQQSGLSFVALGQLFGQRDAATIRHACAITAERLATDPGLAAVAAALGSERGSGRPGAP